jgi:hypothetical protein
MSSRIGRLLLVSCLSAAAHAASFTLQITSTSAPLGSVPSGPLAGTAQLQTIDLTPNVSASYQLNQYSGYLMTSGFPIGTGANTTVVQTVTVNGISAPVTRTVTLTDLGRPGIVGQNCNANIIFSAAATVTLDLGSSGKVDVTLPQVAQAGEECNNGLTSARGVVIVPGTTGALLLHDVPPPPSGIPLPPSVTLSLTGLAAAAAYAGRRRWLASYRQGL